MNVSRLNSLLQDCIDDFAREMLQEQLINHAVSRNPNYTKFIDNFLASLSFMTKQVQIEQQCSKFLKVLRTIGGQNPSEYMKKQLIDNIRTKLNIDLHLDH